MTRSTAAHFAIVLMIGILPLAACKRKPPATSIDALDNQLLNGSVSTDADPAGLRSAIHVDPHRAASAAMHPAATTASSGGDCLAQYGGSLAYATDWAAKLPAELPLPPQARLTEAAGHDTGCRIRAVSFTLPGARQAAIDWYLGKGRDAGYAIERTTRGDDLMIGGSKGSEGFDVIVGPPQDDVIPVDMIWAQRL